MTPTLLERDKGSQVDSSRNVLRMTLNFALGFTVDSFRHKLWSIIHSYPKIPVVTLRPSVEVWSRTFEGSRSPSPLS